MFGERFIESRGAPIEVDGSLVHGIYKRRVSKQDSFELVWLTARDTPVQGICVELDKGRLAVGGQSIKQVVLWRDTAPETTILTCECRTEAELRVWNCWRDVNGVMQAWIGNAGMLIEPSGDRAERVRFRCNSQPEVTFEDLVFELHFLGRRQA